MNTQTRQEAEESLLYISNLCCASEEALIYRKLQAIEGIHNVQFNLLTHQVLVSHSIGEAKLVRALEEIGMPGIPVQSHTPQLDRKASKRKVATVVVSGVFLLLGEILSLTAIPTIMIEGLLVLSVIAGGWDVFIKACRAAKNMTLDINLLMSVAVFGALALGQFGEAAAVIFLFAVSLLIESMSVDRTRQAIQTLLRLSPSNAVVKTERAEVTRPIESIVLGEIIIVKPGDRIPLDGVVLNGLSTVDQSMLTGESIPVVKRKDDPVYAGTFNQHGAIEIQVTKSSADSTIGRIIQLVEDAETKKAGTQTFIERFASVYTPGIFIAAILVTAIPVLLFHQSFNEWFYRSLVLLVVSCPCALLISTPITIVSALTNAARSGVLIKGGIHLEELSKTKCLALDKTGTLTQGKPRIVSILPLNSISSREIIRLSMQLESKSEHPLADAFLEYGISNGIPVDGIGLSEFTSIPGKGVVAKIGTDVYALGNHQLAEQLGICSPRIEKILAELEHQGNTVMLLSNQKEALGVIAVKDTLRSQVNEAIETIRRLGVDRVVLLTGDSVKGTRSSASELSLDEIRAELLPADKVVAVKELQQRYGHVTMVGDGINDAPALAAANVGIVMGQAASDTALETADILLMSENLNNLPFAIRLGQKALATIQLNVVFALAIKAAFVILGTLGITSLWLAILADDGVTLLVALNGMRLLKFK